MKLVVWGINYAPEEVGIAPFNTILCDYLLAQGHEVSMVTAFPYYPQWKKLPEDHFRLYRDDEIRGVKIHRCWHFVPAHVRARWRILHEGSFVFFSTLRLLTLQAPDGVVVVSPPLLLGLAAAFLRLVKGSPYVFHVQDLQPDAALGLGILYPGKFTRMLYALEAIAYRFAKVVSGISQAMVEAFVAKGVSPEKALLFPNGVHLPEPETIPKPGHFRARLGLTKEVFIAAYSGNLGKKQGLRHLLEAARFLEHTPILIVIAGEGAGREELEKMLFEQPAKNVLLLPLQSHEHYLEMLIDANISLITQDTGSGRFFLPSKLLKILAYSRPVFAVSDESSPLVQELKEGGFGVWCPADRPDLIARELEGLLGRALWLREAGQSGRRFVEQFCFSTVLPAYEQSLLKVFRPK